MPYRAALSLVLEILRNLFGDRIKIESTTRLDQIVSTHVSPDALLRLLNDKTGLSITADEIVRCNDVRDLAYVVAKISRRQRPPRVELTHFSINASIDDGCEYPVWYGTNRRPQKSAAGLLDYTAIRDSAVHYGICRVFIPKSHKIGSLGSSWWKRRVLTGVDDRLRLVGLEDLAVDAYWNAMKEALESVDIDDRNAVIFIHGYNVSFEEAALRTAQIGFDLSVSGAMAFF